MHSDCLEELDLEDNLIGDAAGRELLEALEHRKEGKTEIASCIWVSSKFLTKSGIPERI